MTRQQLEHILRACATIADDDEIAATPVDEAARARIAARIAHDARLLG
jgi:hypothetical protein